MTGNHPRILRRQEDPIPQMVLKAGDGEEPGLGSLFRAHSASGLLELQVLGRLEDGNRILDLVEEIKPVLPC